MKNRHTFRLSLMGLSITPVVFRCATDEFRSALASALIDLRLVNTTAKLLIEIGGPAQAAGLPQWLRHQHPASASVPLPDVIRWESASDIYRNLERLYWHEIERVRATHHGHAREAATID